MENQIISSKGLTELQRKKFCLFKKNFYITAKTMPLFKKHAPKYARKVDIVKNECPKTTNPRLKCVKSFLFCVAHSRRYLPSDKLKKSQIFKIIKHHKRFIQSCEGVEKTLKLIKDLPQLSTYEIHYDGNEPEETFNVITRCRALKKLVIDIADWRSSSELPLSSLIFQKNTSRILRALKNMRSLKELSLGFHDESIVSLPVFLQFFASCSLFLSYLERFSINLRRCKKNNLQENFNNDVNVKIALSSVSHLGIPDNVEFEKFVFDEEILRNLKCLRTTVNAKSDCSEANIRRSSMFNLLPKLKDLDLTFNSGSKRMEKVFLENFSLPKEIESMELRLDDFIWKDLLLTKENRRIIEENFENHRRFQRFYNEWKSLNNLQRLKLIIHNGDDERKCPTLALQFAIGILRQVKNLKSLQYENSQEVWNKKELVNKMLPMDMRIFWKSLKDSKKTLENLEIKVTEMNFFAKKCMQEEDFIGGFSRLKNVEIEGQIYWGQSLGDFLDIIAKNNKAKEKICVKVRYLNFKEEKHLPDFFENLVRIPRNLKVKLGLDVSELNCSQWLESFCRFVARLKVEGTLKLQIKEARIESIKEVERIQKSVLENPVFEKLTVQGDRKKNYCVIKRRELVSGVDPWLMQNGCTKVSN